MGTKVMSDDVTPGIDHIRC